MHVTGLHTAYIYKMSASGAAGKGQTKGAEAPLIGSPTNI